MPVIELWGIWTCQHGIPAIVIIAILYAIRCQTHLGPRAFQVINIMPHSFPVKNLLRHLRSVLPTDFYVIVSNILNWTITDLDFVLQNLFHPCITIFVFPADHLMWPMNYEHVYVNQYADGSICLLKSSEILIIHKSQAIWRRKMVFSYSYGKEFLFDHALWSDVACAEFPINMTGQHKPKWRPSIKIRVINKCHPA